MNADTTPEEPQSEFAPIAVAISTHDIQALYACNTNPDSYMQCILAKLKDAGAPVEGVLKLRLAHGAVCKLKDNPMKPQEEFTYIWIPEEYRLAIQNGVRRC